MTQQQMIERLTSFHLYVEKFSNYHFRVDGEIDVFTNRHGDYAKWHDRIRKDRGVKPPEQIPNFIKARLEARLGTPKEEKDHYSFEEIAEIFTKADAEAEIE
jgi:hypothetical protein